ncbi:MAG: hypothetical protein PHQ27_06715, partial [Victivallales bacterium]|nr:hypothetical protein [Victivallales bacterium]
GRANNVAVAFMVQAPRGAQIAATADGRPLAVVRDGNRHTFTLPPSAATSVATVTVTLNGKTSVYRRYFRCRPVK